MRILETGLVHGFPYLEIAEEDGLTVHETYKDPILPLHEDPFFDLNVIVAKNLPKTGLRIASKGVHTLSTVPSMRASLIRRIAEEAGCRMDAPLGSIVYGDSRFIGVFDKAGYRLFRE